MTYPKKNCYWW